MKRNYDILMSKENLTLRLVEENEVEQFNELLSYVFQVTNTHLEESGYTTKKEFITSKKPILEYSHVFGWFDNDKLISQIAIYPCQVNIHGKIFNMGGITGVGTYPEFANKGLMNDLIHTALKDMRANNQWISYLYPYSIPYYRRKGWEIMSDKLSFKLSDAQLPKQVDVKGFVERKDVYCDEVIKVYDKFSQMNHGSLIRTQFNWDEYWRFDNEEEYTAAIYYDEYKIPQGVLFYCLADEVFHIKEMFYLNQEAYNGLWNFIGAHFSMVYWVEGNTFKNEPLSFLLDDGQIKETIEPYYMARIVDVQKFLENYPFIPNDKAFHFIVEDSIASWNNGVFGLSWDKDGNLTINNEEIGKPVKLSIQTLSCLLMNYRRPSYLKKIERLHTDSETVLLLESVCPNHKAYFSDYF